MAVCSDLGYPPPFGEFLDAANRHLPDLVTDRVGVQELLFPNGSMATADAFYRDNAISRFLNLGAQPSPTPSGGLRTRGHRFASWNWVPASAA